MISHITFYFQQKTFQKYIPNLTIYIIESTSSEFAQHKNICIFISLLSSSHILMTTFFKSTI